MQNVYAFNFNHVLMFLKQVNNLYGCGPTPLIKMHSNACVVTISHLFIPIQWIYSLATVTKC